jgi:hypothetical protein
VHSFVNVVETTHMPNAQPKRCSWVNVDHVLVCEYHDREWGVPAHEAESSPLQIAAERVGLARRGGNLAHGFPSTRVLHRGNDLHAVPDDYRDVRWLGISGE